MLVLGRDPASRMTIIQLSDREAETMQELGMLPGEEGFVTEINVEEVQFMLEGVQKLKELLRWLHEAQGKVEWTP